MARTSVKAGAVSTKERLRAASEVARAQATAWLARVLSKPWLWFRRLCFSLGLFVLLTVVGSGAFVYAFFQGLPRVDQFTFEQMQELARKRIESRRETKSHKHQWTPLRDISRELLYSVVVSEDATFFEHSGLNLEMMVSSLVENLKEGKHVYGASTISQQVVKNLFLTNEKTYVRKLKEILLTQRLEKRFKKNEIIELYLNLAEFGPDLFGVAAASQAYFRRGPAAINAAEGAFMALMLPSPKRHYFSVFQNRNLTKTKLRRIERVLRDMLYEEYLSEAQYKRYVRYRYFPETSPRSPARTGP
jgi:monofunctional glycosyltransferase